MLVEKSKQVLSIDKHFDISAFNLMYHFLLKEWILESGQSRMVHLSPLDEKLLPSVMWSALF